MTEIEEIKQKLDIVDVVGQYVQLKKSGKNYKGLCPFHGEKTPSFMVNQELQIFKCFGCNEGGDIFSFVQKIEGYDFRQALEILAERAGVKLKNNFSRNGNAEGNKNILYEVNNTAKKFYRYMLLKHPSGKQALDYLINKRKIDMKSVNDWELGYAPNAWSALTEFMVKKGYLDKDLLRAGVSVPDKFEKKLNDKFRGRIVFPLTGVDGKVLGFGGRTIFDREPKYLNTQETSIFHKEHFLYGLNKTRMELKSKGAVVVEGYMDAISAYQTGINNVVATCGTALTISHLRILSRYTRDLTFCFDADNAGVNATLRAVELCVALDLNPKVAKLPKDCKDIDDVAKLGSNAVKQVIEQAIPAYDFIIELQETRNDLTSPIGKKKFLEEVCYYLAKSPNFVTKEHYAQVLAQKLSTNPDSIINYLKDKTSVELAETSPTTISSNNAKSPQDYLLALVMSQNDLDKYKEILQNLKPDAFEQGQTASLYRKLYDFLGHEGNLSVKEFVAGLEEQDLVKARELALWDIGPLAESEDQTAKEIEETVKRVAKDSIKREMSQLTYKIREAERSGDIQGAEDLMRKFKDLQAKL